ncbi:Hypothetical protein HVR_LOCUS176 [uncultured virus]|nr:Hypothetical protein HVR_LOCUS176 [uncultured virus]
MDNRHTIKTGDVLLFSNNSPTGFLLRTFVSSVWNHSGIAVRFIISPDPTAPDGLKKEVSLNEEGELYILETNTGMRKDDISGINMLGAGFSKVDWVFNKYNRIAVRRLHDVFRTPQFAELTLDFYNKNKGSRFPSSSLPFLGVWLGISFTEKDPSRNEMFCSELMAHYYTNCIGPQYEQVTGLPFDGKLSTLFGTGAPLSEDMFTPGHYTCNNTPNASIFSGGEEIIYTAYADMLYVILQPLLIILVVMLAIWMTLPK